MTFFMKRFQHQTYALLRIVAGFLFLWHGSQKLFGFPGSGFDPPAFIKYVAGPMELLGGFLILIGFYTRPAAFLCSGLMAFAYWMGHGTKDILPIQNGGELAMLYCFLFLFICSQGSGKWSVDNTINKTEI